MSKYYSANQLLSHNGIFNFAVGQRGNGKTFDGKFRIITNAIKRGEEGIYVRRYKTELQASKPSFFSDISWKFPNWEFRIRGNKGEAAKYLDPDKFESEADYNKAKKTQEWITVVHFIALSTAAMQKSIAYPKVTLILYDEFIIGKGAHHYMPDEEQAFKNFYITVDRYREMQGRKPVTVLFIANSVSIMNPYFIAYDIVPDDQEKEYVKRQKGFIVIQFIDSDDFSKEIYKTRFGQFIEGTEFADTAVSNQFHDNNDSLVEIKGYKAKYQYTLETENGRFSVWYEKVHNRYYVQAKDNKDPIVFTLLPERMDEDKTLVSVRDKMLQYLRASFNTGRMFFDKPSTRNTFREIFKR